MKEKENYNIESITSFEKEWIRKDEVLKPLNKIKKYIDCINPKYCSCKRCPNCNIFYHKLVKAVDNRIKEIEGKK